ncbi:MULTISPECIES: choline ABC transporter permease subunit [Alphaproteobacteria]|uniref:Choline ABC transporter permease subunit n=2 Tax=Alphaproteobacteria TaxID=28211 RepID=A0A512HF67_9HYPH|nr:MULTISPECIES: choline ABC transporter permease subunit [Alphaproteobacteria]GEO84010.1 choline ABC transporter permease subunit [Ciceribacter naphthalenivorans]GLR21112.1 choline ABC transporter permease subunit [Ciceribacter naphthalenivorans]GLT03968.1 choline ABC transporter permease subunit [Sphingomonas psychrolutea]
MDWLTDYKIPIGVGAKQVVDLLTTHLKLFFDFIAMILSASINAMLFVLQAPYLKGTALADFYPLIMILIFTAIAWLMRRSIGIAVFTLIGLLVIYNQGYWKETMETLALVLAATGVSMVVGVPIGIAAARRPWLYSVIRPILDLMQTIPTFVYLIPALILFGLGMVPGLIATVIFAIPAPIRLTRLGIISTPPSLVEAAQAFGATPSQVLRKVELPFAMPQIMAGLTQTIMLSLSMVVIAALVGASGLGVPVVRALNTVNIAKGFESGLCIVILAIILDRIFRPSDEGDAA